MFLFPYFAAGAGGFAGYKFLGGDKSKAKTESEQNAETYLSQQYAGTCSITCNNKMSNVTMNLIDSYVAGDFSLEQSCSTNGTCIMSNNMDSVANVNFNAKNSSNAKDSGSFFGSDYSSAKGRQNIRETILQSSNQNCNMSSYNQMDDITMHAEGSYIGGNMSLKQVGNVSGTCSLNDSMSAAAYATGMIDNDAQSGKDKKGSMGLGKITFSYVIAFMIIAIIAFVIAKLISAYSSKKDQGSSSTFVIPGFGGGSIEEAAMLA